MKNRLIILLLTLFLASGGYSYSFFSTSRQGPGLRQYITTVRGLGMGGTGLASVDQYALNAYNIANWLSIQNTRMTAEMQYQVNKINLGNQQFSTTSGNFSGVQLAIPVKQNKWVVGLNITPYSYVDFSFIQPHSTSATNYEEYIIYQGNITRSQLNVAWAPNPRIGLAASFNYFFGTIIDHYKLDFNDPDYYNSAYELEYEFHGPGAGFSLHLQPVDSLNIGGFLDLRPRLFFNTIFRASSRQDIQTTSSTSTMPVNWGVGLSYSFLKNWTVSGDFVYQKWSKGFGIETIDRTALEDWSHLAIGVEHSHLRKRARSMVQKIDLRSGFSVSNLGYKFNNHSVKEYAFHIGTGIPFYQNLGRLDIALITGIRGDLSKTLAQEKFVKLYLSISAGELWFQKLR